MSGDKDAGEEPLYEDGYWQTADGLKLHYRDYPAPVGCDGAIPMICIPGLTRNARDFEGIAEEFGKQRRVLCLELRGRGESEYARDASTYNPLQYAQDLGAFFAQTGIEKAIFVGTSLGGIVTMIYAFGDAGRIAGAVLNDIGPIIGTHGVARIASFVGHQRSFPTWMHAARAMQEALAEAFPDWELEDWIRHAKRIMVLGPGGRISFDYDMRIAEAFAPPPDGAPPPSGPDLWPGFDALEGRPVLVVRGETSDILSDTTAREMVGRIPDVELVTVPRIGHAPTLDEPMVRDAIARLVAKIG